MFVLVLTGAILFVRKVGAIVETVTSHRSANALAGVRADKLVLRARVVGRRRGGGGGRSPSRP